MSNLSPKKLKNLPEQFTSVEPAEAMERAWTFPTEWYTDARIFELEQERIFKREWQYVGHTSQLSDKPGSYFTAMVGQLPIVVIRQQDGELAAYVNVCPHRGSLVATGSGCRSVLQCRYHGWTFNLDGSLRVAPRSDRESKFDTSDISLRPMRLDTWGPLIFVNPDLNAAPLSNTLGGIATLIKERGFDLYRHHLRASRQHEIKCNWKVTLDNNTECYHCNTVHPGFSKNYHVDADNYSVFAFDRSFSHLSPLKDKNYDGPWNDFHLYYLWPNFMLSARGNDYFYTYSYVPVDAHTTIQYNDFFFPESYSDSEVEEAIGHIEQIMREDWDVFEKVQVGLRSGMLAHGLLMPDNEQLLRHFQRLIVNTLEK
ncbi:aromatic ring-hydroxylating oxygenase subunit alpha [Ammoniphilus resinae]|uniref:Choline monooxygenase n=1 Tax=Ammoniphilus resinae TaxID=861532 RepID=A0ABS4GNM5_9BACL|nr:aromatic ring-hydroxylating dioxygenase subunit alpha [Ammoniphilus resinae]MBP1931877.1 choline monooxygenase [Ammoniphilus resinae]